jgi:hypothetical protein
MSRTSDNQIHCDNCDTLTETGFRQIRLYRFGKDFYLDDVKTKTCPNCDNFYLSAKTIDECNSLIQQRRERELVAA